MFLNILICKSVGVEVAGNFDYIMLIFDTVMRGEPLKRIGISIAHKRWFDLIDVRAYMFLLKISWGKCSDGIS